MFKFLYHNHGVRYFIQESDFQYGYYVHKYLKTGDSTWIGRGGSEEAHEFHKQLYAFNNTLTDSAKLFFASIDAYAFQDTEVFLDKMTLGKSEPSGNVKIVIELLKPIKKTHSKGFGMDIRGKDKNRIMEKLNEARAIVREHQHEFEDYFKDEYVFFHLLIFNKATEIRSDKNLAANFLEFQKFHNEGKFFIQYGNLHCQKKSGWFADQINTTPRFTNRVCSFVSQYADSEYWLFDIRKESDFGIVNAGNYNKKIMESLRTLSKADCTLFKTNDIGYGIEKSTDYIFFLKNQKAMHSNYKKPE